MVGFIGAGSAGLAGCLGDDDGDGNGGGNGGGNGSGTDNGNGDDESDPAALPPVHFFTDYNNDAWQERWENELLPQFTDETDIEVEIEYSGFSGDNEDRLATLVQSGDPPAINTSTFDQIADLWASDQLTTTTEIVEQVESVAGEMISRPFEQDGDTWQVSHGYYTSILSYREDVFEELGLEPPSSFEQLVENARVIEESDLDIRGYGLAGGKAGKSQDEFHVFMARAGGPTLGIRYDDLESAKEKPPSERELVIDFPEDKVVAILELFDELANYSPDPTNVGWAESLGNWAGGQFAQQYNLNMWPAGVAASADAEEIARNTGVAALPTWEAEGFDDEDAWLDTPTPDGHHVFADADNTPGAKRLLEWLYGDSMDRTATMYVTEPTRFLPNYEDVIDSDTFRSYDHWEEYPSHLEGMEKCQKELVPAQYGHREEPALHSDDPVALYVQRFFFYGEMVNQVITDSATPEEAYEFGLDKLEQRLEEGRERFR